LEPSDALAQIIEADARIAVVVKLGRGVVTGNVRDKAFEQKAAGREGGTERAAG